MKQFSLGKRHKLCSTTGIDRLFKGGASSRSVLAYPLRAVWTDKEIQRRPHDEPFKMLISVPKKRLRRAVDRVTMRRRIREAYRLNRPEFAAGVADGAAADIAFIYVADNIRPTAAVNHAMRKLLASIMAPAEQSTAAEADSAADTDAPVVDDAADSAGSAADSAAADSAADTNI